MLKSMMLVCGLLSLSLSASALTKKNEVLDENFFQIDSVKISEVPIDALQEHFSKSIDDDYLADEIKPDPIETTGRVINIARDLVALGEEVYSLVTKGRPTVTTKYAPISVVPKLKGEPVDILDTEDWKMPKKKSFQVSYYNTYKMKVVDFRFSVMWAYGGKYDGKGAYITSAQITPDFVKVLFGFDFTATMKLGGLQNSGKREDPVAVATLLLEHTVSNIFQARSVVTTFVIDGKGQFKKY